MGFSFEGANTPVPVNIIGAPNKDNAIRGIVDFDRAASLFDALSSDRYITIAFKYADGTVDAVKIRGFRDRNRGNPMEVLKRCLHGYPPDITGPMFPIH